MTTSTICITITIVLYLAGMLWIGAHYAKKNASASDFYLGGRKLGPLVTAMSAEASDMSSYLLMGLPGLAYLTGMADVGWTAIGLAAGTYLNWLFTARRLRRYTQITGAYTLPQFFSQRFKAFYYHIHCFFIRIFFAAFSNKGHIYVVHCKVIYFVHDTVYRILSCTGITKFVLNVAPDFIKIPYCFRGILNLTLHSLDP